MLDYGDFSDSTFGLIDEHFCSHKIPLWLVMTPSWCYVYSTRSGVERLSYKAHIGH